MPLPILKGLGINNIGLPQTGAFSLEAMRNQSNVPADTLGLIAGVLYSGAKDKEDIKKVATTIANRAKESKITPLQVITKGYTEVGEDSGAKFKPFLAGDYSRGGLDVADESYRIARELFSGTFVPVGTFNSMVANPNTGANDYYYQNQSTNKHSGFHLLLLVKDHRLYPLVSDTIGFSLARFIGSVTLLIKYILSLVCRFVNRNR